MVCVYVFVCGMCSVYVWCVHACGLMWYGVYMCVCVCVVYVWCVVCVV